MVEAGDIERQIVWKRIVAAVKELQRCEREPGEPADLIRGRASNRLLQIGACRVRMLPPLIAASCALMRHR